MAAIDIVYDPSAPKAFVDMVMESVDWIWNEETKSFLKKESQVNEEKNVSVNPMPWFDTLVEMKTEIKTMQDKIFILTNENKKIQTLLENKVTSQVRKKEEKLEKLLEDTKSAVELSVKEKLRERREHETLKIFDNFLKEIAKN